MKKLWPTFRLPCRRGSRWGMAVSATRYVRQQASGAPRSGRGDPRVSLISPATRKHKTISDSEKKRMRQIIERKNECEADPFDPGGVRSCQRLALETCSLSCIQNPQIHAHTTLRIYYFSCIDFGGWEVRLLRTNKKTNEATEPMQNNKPESSDEIKRAINNSTWRLAA
jgi:hypothetical protein